jgi:hypothetical protein
MGIGIGEVEAPAESLSGASSPGGETEHEDAVKNDALRDPLAEALNRRLHPWRRLNADGDD